jgi:hypothetical protein
MSQETSGAAISPPDCTVYAPAKIWGLTLSPSPDLRPTKLLIATAAVMTLIAAVRVSWGARIGDQLGDADDATRLTLVRDLLAGRGWYDQIIDRMAPPSGVFLHWSRLLDGALAMVERVFALFLSPAQAELAMRFCWPLAWIFPAVAAGLLVARSLGARPAVLITAVLMSNPFLYTQFVPGRIDHHNVQIVMTMVALAGATALANRRRWAVAAGLASAVGMAVGLEALAFHAIIGASYALALARKRDEAPRALAYALALAATTIVLFLVETPPQRWGLSFCDAIALNLVAAIALAGTGLATTALLAPRVPGIVRIGLVALTGIAAASLYLGLHPACLHGPFADIDPAIKPIWFDHIQETEPLSAVYPAHHQGAIIAALMCLSSLAAATFLLARGRPKLETGPLTLFACLTVAVPVGLLAWRMQDYVFWFGTPALAAAASWITARRLRGLMVPSALAPFFLSPLPLGILIAWALGLGHMPPQRVAAASASLACTAKPSYAALTRLPKGRILAPIDLGPPILAFTPHSVLSAPYHRLSKPILAAHKALDALPGEDEARARSLGADYIVDCPAYPSLETAPNGLSVRLRQGRTPAWLTSLSGPGDTLQIYRVADPR